MLWVQPLHDVIGLRPFVPAKDFEGSLAFYRSLGFSVLHKDDTIAILMLDRSGFILQNYYVEAFAANCVLQLLVRDVDAWWANLHLADAVTRFGVQAAAAPAMQPWGSKVGFLWDPSGVLWQVTQSPE